MKIKILLVIAGAAIAVPTMLRAQPNPTAPQEQFEQTQHQMQLQNPPMLNLSTNTEAPEIYPGENADVGPQHILKSRPPRKTWFEVVADSQYYYSDNLKLSDGDKVSGPLFVNTIQAAFAPEAFQLGSGQFAPTVGYRSQWFNYGLGGGPSHIDMLDFNAQTAFASGRYQMGLWSVFGEFDFTRLLDQDKYKEVYREYVPTIGIQRTFPVCDKLAFSVGGQVDYHWTEIPKNSSFPQTDVNNRFDASLLLAAAWQVMPKLVLQPFYRLQFTDYQGYADGTTESDGVTVIHRERQDVINTLGTTLTYYITKNISARIFANYEIKDNDFSKTYDYHKFDGGGGAGLDIRF